MNAPIRLRRSFFYAAPMHAPMLQIARDASADIVCLDLEDSTPPASKTAARKIIADYLAAGRPSCRELLVRVNALDTEWGHDDLRFAASLDIDGVLLPKVEGDGIVRQAQKVLAEAKATPPRLWCLVESPLAILRLEQIASCDIEGLVVGGADLAEALGARHVASRLPLWHALSQVVLAARAYGLTAIDAMHSGPKDDLSGLEAACSQAADLGFDGKSVFTLDGVRLANSLFIPSADDVAKARAALDGGGGYGAHLAHAEHVLAVHRLAMGQ